MMADVIHWHGSPEEAEELEEAIRPNCSCVFSEQDAHCLKRCEPHKMTLTDQRALDGLLAARHSRQHFLHKEWTSD